MAQVERALDGVPAGPVAEEVLTAGQVESSILSEGI